MREEIAKLLKMGPFPNEANVTPDIVDSYHNLLSAISRPVSLGEAKSLLALFGTDDFFGVAWMLVHLIESCSEWSTDALIGVNDNIWITELRERLQPH
jgi:hypothetical protein